MYLSNNRKMERNTNGSVTFQYSSVIRGESPRGMGAGILNPELAYLTRTSLIPTSLPITPPDNKLVYQRISDGVTLINVKNTIHL